MVVEVSDGERRGDGDDDDDDGFDNHSLVGVSGDVSHLRRLDRESGWQWWGHARTVQSDAHLTDGQGGNSGIKLLKSTTYIARDIHVSFLIPTTRLFEGVSLIPEGEKEARRAPRLLGRGREG